MARPIVPEPKYFLNDQNLSLADYHHSFFGHCNGEQVLGEKSTSYYEFDEAALRIKQTLPGARIVFVLRNPVERALSNYFFSHKNGLDPRSLDEVFCLKIPPPRTEYKTSVDPFNYVGRGDYARAINHYLSIFGHERVGVFLYEHLTRSLDGICSLCTYIGAERSPAFLKSVSDDLGTFVNAAPREHPVEDAVLSAIRLECAPLVAALRDCMPGLDLNEWKDFS